MNQELSNKKIKLIALDMDGTLLNENNEVSEENRKAIKAAEAKGVKVILSTGRSYPRCSEYAKALELSSYLITVNGGEIFDSSGKLIERTSVNTDLVQWMWDLSQKHKTHYWAVSSEQVYRANMPENIHDSEWIKFGFDIDDDAVREEILQELKNDGTLEISNSSPTNIEVNALGVNKAVAIEKVCSFMGLAMENVMACGDSLNDIAMIKEAGIGVAMGNAQKTVKDTADWVTATNREDGVAKAIHKWVLDVK
ncbi:Cof-type HAD-IIB family hydrolase [Peribacillus sp. B-H-3]|uniref:Cof-type HAD-IIB family hydrolase n=1 Tax=Peribacillus sp. B-H-3 TaxID=3400420 RepID=UPI003B01DF99